MSAGANHRVIAAVEMLRSLQADGFSVPLLVELALGPKGRQHDRPVEERQAILDLYREALEPSARRVVILKPQERAPIDPDMPVFANFERTWPQPLSGEARERAVRHWQRLGTADRKAAIAAVPTFIEARNLAGFAGRELSGAAYLSAGNWRNVR